MLKKISRFLCALSVLLLITAAACAGSAAPDVHSYDCDGVPMTIHADFSAFPVVPVAERKCAYASKDELIQIRNRIPWQALGIHDLPRDEWAYDGGVLCSPYPPKEIFLYSIYPYQLSIHRHENYEYWHPYFGWYRPSPYARGRHIINTPDDTQYDTQNLKLQVVLQKGRDYAKAFSLDIREPAQITYCIPPKGQPFYQACFPVYLDNLVLHYLSLNTGFPNEGTDTALPFIIAWNEDGLIALDIPLVPSLKVNDSFKPPISAEEAAAALQQNFSDQWLPDVKSIVVDKMELIYFPYSGTIFASNGFTVHPAWIFSGHFDMTDTETPVLPFNVCINALTGKPVY